MSNTTKKTSVSATVKAAIITMVGTIIAAAIGVMIHYLPPSPTTQSDKVFVIVVLDSRTRRKLESVDVSLSIDDVPYNKHTGNDGAVSFPIPQDKIGHLADLHVEKEGYEPYDQQIRVTSEEKVIWLKGLP